jgi:hypothetical protein
MPTRQTGTSIRNWTRKLHLYLGLLSLSSLVLLGSSGLVGFLHQSRDDSGVRHRETYTLPLDVEPGQTGTELADQVLRQHRFSLAIPKEDNDIRIDADGNYATTFYTVNGEFAVTILENEAKVRVVESRLGFPGFLVRAHATLFRPSIPGQDWRITLLSTYMFIAVGALLVLVPSGLGVWLLIRPGHRLARIALASSSGLFIALWIAIR